MGLKWTSIFCPQAKYILKTDDDIYVNVPLLHQALQKESSKLSNSIHGKLNKTLLFNMIDLIYDSSLFQVALKIPP